MARKSVGTPATVQLARAGVAFSVHSYEHADGVTAYGQEAADALGVAADRIFKTLLADLDGSLVVAVVPVTGQLDLKALAAALGGKRAAMADPRAAERSSGYVVGGISPFGQRKPLRTVLDVSAEDHPTIFVSAGRRGVEVEVSPADLVDVLGGSAAPISRS